MATPTQNKLSTPANNIRPPPPLPLPIPPPSSGLINFPNNNNNQIPPFPNTTNISTQQQQLQQQNNFLNPHFPPPINNNNSNQFFDQFQQQQQQQQMFCANPMMPMMMMMNPATLLYNQQNNVVANQQQQQQALVQNAIQNISQLLQLQSNPIQNMNQNQFGMINQGNPFLPPPSSLNFQNQMIPQGVVPPQIQNQNPYMNPMFSMMPNSNVPMQQHVNNHGQPRFVSPPYTQTVQTQNSAPNITEDNNGANVNGKWADSRHKNFSGHKTNDASQKRFKSHKNMKEKFGIHNYTMSKGKANNSIVNSGPGNSTSFEMKLPSLKYTEQEIKQWREARKKHYPKSITAQKGKKEQTLSEVNNHAVMLRRQQLKEVLAKQAELGVEVAEIPSSYLSSPPRSLAHDSQNRRDKKPERERYKKGKFQKKRGRRSREDRLAKRTRKTHEQKPNECEKSLLEKLLTRDVKRDKNHLLQVFRFVAANAFFTEKTDSSLIFPSVIVRETNPRETEMETIGSVSKVNDEKEEDEEEEEEEGEITD